MKSQVNHKTQIILGQGGPASNQWSHPNRFRQWDPLFCYNNYPQIRLSAQNQVIPNWDFDFLPTLG